MELVLAVVIGSIYAVGFYMMMRRNIVRLIVGLVLMGYATNLLIFEVGRLTRGAPPIVPLGETVPLEPIADPVPQALILTAIVIGFGLQAFALVLVKRVYQTVETADVDAIRSTDQ